jgi:type IV pilus assembly protein PilP
MMNKNKAILTSIVIIAAMVIASCDSGSKDRELSKYISKIKSRPPRAIDAIPEYKPLPKFSFPEKIVRRNPFMPLVDTRDNSRLAPNLNRSKQPLEAYALDSLKFAGILKRGNLIWALVVDSAGKVNRVRVGNYMGKNYGKILRITNKTIELEETVRVGGLWKKKMTTINLNTKK